LADPVAGVDDCRAVLPTQLLDASPDLWPDLRRIPAAEGRPLGHYDHRSADAVPPAEGQRLTQGLQSRTAQLKALHVVLNASANRRQFRAVFLHRGDLAFQRQPT